jgi:hypothetical protein
VAYRVFYYDDAKDVQIAADGAVERDTEAIIALMDEVLVEPGSFVGVLEDDESLLTFVVLDDGIQLDIPQGARRGSYFKKTTLATCKQVLRDNEGGFRFEQVPDLVFEKW